MNKKLAINETRVMEVQFDADGTPFVRWGDSKIQLETGPVTDPVVLEKAKKELRETPEIVQHALVELKQRLKGIPSLNIPVDNDNFLLKFLRPCKFYEESAFKRVQVHYKYRHSHARYSRDLVPSAVRPAFDQNVITVLTPRDQHGRRLLVLDAGEKWNVREISITDAFRSIQVALEVVLMEPVTQICGIVIIFDVKGLTLHHVFQFTPAFAKNVLDWLQNCFPMRLKALHVVNQSYIFNVLFAICKPFITEKLRSRMFFHGFDKQSLLNMVDKKALLKRHGGILPEPEIPGEVIWQLLSQYENELSESYSYGYKNIK